MDSKLTQNNIFSFTEPDQLKCMLEGYAIGRSELNVRVFSENRRTIARIVFYVVEYLNTPARRNGANFTIAPAEDCLAILRKNRRFDNMPDLYLLSRYKLYVLYPSKEVNIIAETAEVIATQL